MILLCKDNKKQKFTGDKITAYDFQLCNKTYHVQTDVGVCIGSNPIQILQESKIISKLSNKTVGGNLRDIEHSFVIIMDDIKVINAFSQIHFSLILKIYLFFLFHFFSL